MTAYNKKTIEQKGNGMMDNQKATLTGTGKTYYPLTPGMYSMVTLNKDTSIATLKFTCDYANDTLENAEYGAAVSTGADDYQKGFTPGFTGVELDVTTYTNDLEIRILQHVIGY